MQIKGWRASLDAVAAKWVAQHPAIAGGGADANYLLDGLREKTSTRVLGDAAENEPFRTGRRRVPRGRRGADGRVHVALRRKNGLGVAAFYAGDVLVHWLPLLLYVPPLPWANLLGLAGNLTWGACMTRGTMDLTDVYVPTTSELAVDLIKKENCSTNNRKIKKKPIMASNYFVINVWWFFSLINIANNMHQN